MKFSGKVVGPNLVRIELHVGRQKIAVRLSAEEVALIGDYLLKVAEAAAKEAEDNAGGRNEHGALPTPVGCTR
jgi:hypothetical protein